uniref:Immunoglobulin domain-containing protein n=1 Tax=Stegastes partitus TaxID=144197 RepID=A0A3B5B4M3_9TELE
QLHFLQWRRIVSCSHNLISGSVLNVTARPEDNITIYCDCKISNGIYIVWFRNCSHENQPTLVLKTFHSKIPRFAFERNFSSDSWDLLLKNITHADEGLYYCGTMQLKVENNGYITPTDIYRYNDEKSSDTEGQMRRIVVIYSQIFY